MRLKEGGGVVFYNSTFRKIGPEGRGGGAGEFLILIASHPNLVKVPYPPSRSPILPVH
jgi:hypothetical protein